MSSIICVHHLHHRHQNHLRESVWFNGTRSSIFRSFASDMSNQEHLVDFKDQPQQQQNLPAVAGFALGFPSQETRAAAEERIASDDEHRNGYPRRAMQLVHERRAAKCERDVLARLLSVEQVRTVSIDTQQSTIEYLQLDGTTHRTKNFPMGSKVGDVVLGLGWCYAEVINRDGEVLNPTSIADENHIVMVKENSGILTLPEAQELAAKMQKGLGIVDLPTKCRQLAEVETTISAIVRERIDSLKYSVPESRVRNGQIHPFDIFTAQRKYILFNVRMALLSYSATLHLERGGDETNFDEFLNLIREFKPDGLGAEGWMDLVRHAIVQSRIFPSMLSESMLWRQRFRVVWPVDADAWSA